ncbi:hypothetical protein BRADO2947 [Bradyrhizobium sp. ORS 278]|nr:hypothetical protein BRADO2947 [Bradyrhizobium sp. ORS 278]
MAVAAAQVVEEQVAARAPVVGQRVEQRAVGRLLAAPAPPERPARGHLRERPVARSGRGPMA